MSKYKIAVYAISKNEEKFVDRWVDAMSEADGIYVTDTGSTDATVDKLLSRGAVCNTAIISPWRFDTARNKSLSYVPEDVDICVCTDLDEVFESGWREKLENAWTAETCRMCYMFSPNGISGPRFWKEKIHRRHGFKWIRPVHEILEYTGKDPYCETWEPSILLNHFPDLSKPRSQYLPLLELSVEEDPDDDRNMHYLGREYMYTGQWDKAIETLKRHLQMPSAGWKEERCASMRFIGRCYKSKGDYGEAKKWYYKAIAEAPNSREPYVEMALLAYDERNWPCVYHMIEEALRITVKPAIYLNESFCWDATVYDLGGLSCFELGLYNKCYEYTKKALELRPDDKRLINNLVSVRQIIEKK